MQAGFSFGPGTRMGRVRRIGYLGDVSMALSFNPITAGISAGVGLASTAVTAWMGSLTQSHNADTYATVIVNGLAQQLQNLHDAYFSETNPSCADQRAALDAFDAAWQWLQSPAACGNPSCGAACNRCISERGPGGKYSYFSAFRDPIANDPRMAGFGCDTGQTVFLPTPGGTYTNTGITSTGGSSQTGQSAQQVAQTTPQSVASTASSSTIAGIPSSIFFVGAALLGGFILAEAL